MRATTGLLILLVAACNSPAPDSGDPGSSGNTPSPWFEEIAGTAGVEFVCESGHRERFLFPEGILGGGALLDIENDGDLDLYLVQGGKADTPVDGPPNQLFRNRGDGTFEEITESSGAGDRRYGMGAAVGDYDGDGDIDLYVTNLGPNVLLQNDGSGTFTDVSEAAGVDDPAWGTSAAFLDYDRDGDLDLFVVNYVHWSVATELDCYSSFGAKDYCKPTNYNAPATDTLLRNEGDGTFRDVTTEAGLRSAFGNGLGIVPGDFDGNGWIDVFVANDTMMNQLWINQGDGSYKDEALVRGCATDEHGKTKAGMGVATGDPDDDDDLDILVVNLTQQSDSYFNNRQGIFSDRTAASGLATASRPYTRFGLGFQDFDNDGYLDVYQASGGVQISAEPLTEDPFAQPNVLLRGAAGGKFTRIDPLGGTAEPTALTSRAAAFGDLDNDGGIDVVVVNRDGPVQVLHNVAAARGGNWVGFEVIESDGTVALSATVRLQISGRTLRREVQPAYSYCAANDMRVHFGLGPAPVAVGVTVRWADGGLESFGDFKAGSYYKLRHGDGAH